MSTETALWHLRQAERILIDAEVREAVEHGPKYGDDKIHDCKISLWRLMEKMPEGI